MRHIVPRPELQQRMAAAHQHGRAHRRTAQMLVAQWIVQPVAKAAADAVDSALDDFRDNRATVGRARIFGEKSIGLDDPGMLAKQAVVKAAVDG